MDKKTEKGDGAQQGQRARPGGPEVRSGQAEQIAREEFAAPDAAVPESLSNSAGFLLNRAGRIIHDRVESVLSPLKLSARELGVLRIISAEGMLNQQSLGKMHNIDRSTMVQIIDQLEAREIVQRTTNPSDRRSHMLSLTPRGRKIFQKAVRLVQEEQAKFLTAISEEEWQQMRSTLIKIIGRNHD